MAVHRTLEYHEIARISPHNYRGTARAVPDKMQHIQPVAALVSRRFPELVAVIALLIYGAEMILPVKIYLAPCSPKVHDVDTLALLLHTHLARQDHAAAMKLATFLLVAVAIAAREVGFGGGGTDAKPEPPTPTAAAAASAAPVAPTRIPAANAGILAASLYVPSCCVGQAELAAAQGHVQASGATSLSHGGAAALSATAAACVGLTGDCEDGTSMALSALASLLEAYNVHPREVRCPLNERWRGEPS